MRVARSVVAVLTTIGLVTVVMLARVKLKIGMIRPDIRFEGAVFGRSQSGRRSGIAEWDDVIVHEIRAVARRVRVKFVFRNLFALMPGHFDLLPMGVQTRNIDQALADRENGAGGGIVFRLEKNHGGPAFRDSSCLFSEVAPADVGPSLRIVLI